MFYVYMLRLSDGTLYTGSTNDLNERLKAHREGKGSKYVKGRLPFDLVYVEAQESRSNAVRRELEIKKLNREKKEKLIEVKRADLLGD